MNQMDPTFFKEIPDDALAPGSTLLNGQFTIQSYLSSGGFGITYLATDSLNRTVVIKECYPEAFCARVNKSVRARTKTHETDFQSIVKLFVREARSLAKLNHSSVVGVHQVFEDNDTAYMALDLIEGRDLLDLIEDENDSLTPDQVRHMTLELLDAIDHIHGQDVLHRDISPDNILVEDNGHPVLIDFGAAREEASRKSRVLSSVLVVKDGYSPQEFYLAGSQQFPSSDLYALAASLAHLISGEAPPNSQARLAALAAHQPDLYHPLEGRIPGYDDTFLRAIDTAMNIIPANRIQSAKEWAAMIDPSRRQAQALAEAEDDASITQTITSLVATVNQDLEQAAPRKPDPAPKSTIEAAPSEDAQKARPPVEIIPSQAEIQAEIEQWEREHKSTEPERLIVTPPARATTSGKRSWRRLFAIPIVLLSSFLLGQMTLAAPQVRELALRPLLSITSDSGGTRP